MRFFTSLIASSAAFLATPTQFLHSKPGHCDAAVVKDSCLALSGGASEEKVTAEQLRKFFAGEKVYDDEVEEYLERFFESYMDVAEADGAVSCKALCKTAVHMYAAQLPWTVDTGCKHQPSASDESEAVTVCDIDLDFAHLKDLEFKDNQNRKDTEHDAGEHSGKVQEEDLEVIFQRMDKSLLRSFRSYPLNDISVEVSAEGEAAAEKSGVDVPMAMERKAETPLEAAVETAVSAFLQLRTAPSFLQLSASAQSAASAYSVACVHDAEFRAVSGLCPSFLDEHSVFLEMQAKHPQLAGASFEESQEGCPSTCALSGHVAAGCEGCSAFVETGLQRVAKVQAKTGQVGWKQDVAKVSVKAQAYLEKVAQGMARNEYSEHLKVWYGRDSESVRREVKRILASVSNMIDNVDYVYPGPQCSPNTYAYVYPNAGNGYTFTPDGSKFRFYLCPYYMKVDLGEQIETLTHEGSHHRKAYTDDVPHPTMSGQKAYGRSTCKTLARTNPTSALKNADSFCYFVQDSAEKGDTKPAPKPASGGTYSGSSYRPSSGTYSGSSYRPYGSSGSSYRPTYGSSTYGSSTYGSSTYGSSTYGSYRPTYGSSTFGGSGSRNPYGGYSYGYSYGNQR